MQTRTWSHVLDHIRKQVEPEGARDLGDADLLERFRARGDEAAFALLVQRHGPMVLGLCRRLLGDPAEAEDAFQATFLLLVRKSDSIRKRESLAGWLHGVAYRVATRARAHGLRRRALGHLVRPAVLGPDVLDALVGQELGAILDEEIQRLPSKYRLALVLCALGGKTHEEAARELGWAKSSVTARLSKARQLLRSRLLRRGFSVPALLLGGRSAAAVGTPARLVLATTRLAGEARAGHTPPTSAAALADGFRGGIRPTRLAGTVLLLVLVGLTAAGASVLSGPAQPYSKPSPPLKAERPGTDPQGDPLPPGAVARIGTVRLRHAGPVQALAFAPDGKSLVSLGSDNRTCQWDAISGRSLRRLPPDPGVLLAVAFAPDGKAFATGSIGEGGIVCLREAATGRELWRCPVPARTLAFAPDGKTLASSNGSTVILLHDAATGREFRRLGGHHGSVRAVAFSPDGRALASAAWDGTIRLWDVNTGKEVCRLDGTPDTFDSVVFTPDGRSLATEGNDLSVCLWELAAGKVRTRLRPRRTAGLAGLGAVVLSADGKTLAVGRDGAIHRWQLSTGKELPPLRGHHGNVTALAFAPDGKSLASAGADHSVRLWDAAGRERLTFPEHPGAIDHVFFLPGGRRLATTGIGTVRLWEADSGREVTLPANTGVLAPDGRHLARCDAGAAIHLHTAADGKEVRVLRGHRAVPVVAFAADGKTLVSASHKDRAVVVWDVEGKELRRLPGPIAGLMPLVLAGGRRLLVCGWEGDGRRHLRVWDVGTGKELCHVEQEMGLPYALSPDGKTLAQVVRVLGVPSRDEVVVRDVGTSAVLFRVPWSGGGSYASVAGPLTFAPDGQTLTVPAGPDADELRLIDRRTGRELRRLRGHRGPISDAVFAADGHALATTGADRTVRLWNTATGRERCRFRGHAGEVVALAFSQDGRRLASASQDTTVLVWDTTGQTGAGVARLNDLSR